MAKRMTETQERNRPAREIHDTLGRTLTGVAAEIDACLATIGASPQRTKDQLELISEVTRDGIREIQRLVSQLHPDALERFDLEYAISEMVSDMNTVSGVRMYFDYQIKSPKFDEDEENAVYRVVQGGITNALRHGHANQVWTIMKKRDTDILLQIGNNRVGCKEIKSRFGTKYMKERIKMLSGVVTFDDSDGLTVNAGIPIR